MATLTLRGLRKAYGTVEVIKGIDLDIAERELVVFVGPSGCGKSTLLRMIAGLEQITAGELQIDGKRVNEVGPADRGLAMVFQSYALYPHMTVRQNMGFALRLAKVPKSERDRKVNEASRILQLDDYLERRPKDLSGGQRQRVAIGRAIVRDPKVFLFDEPLSNLDAALRGQMRIELSRLHEELNATMVYVTHDQIEAMTMADKNVVLRAGEVEQVGSPRMNMLAAKIVAVGASGAEVELKSGARLTVRAASGAMRPGEAVMLGIRPEALRPDPAGVLQGEVRLVEQLGGLTLLHVSAEGIDDMTVQIEGSDGTRAHQPVRLSVDTSACHLFDGAGLALEHLVRHPLLAA